MTQGALLLSLSNKWLWPGTAQPRWAAQVSETHSPADQSAQGGVATPRSSHSVPCSRLLHCRAPDSRNSGSRLPFLAILQDTQMAPRPNPYVDTAVTCPALRPQDRSPFTLSLPSALPILPASWPDAQHRPRVWSVIHDRKYRFFIATQCNWGGVWVNPDVDTKKEGKNVTLFHISHLSSAYIPLIKENKSNGVWRGHLQYIIPHLGSYYSCSFRF